MTVTDLPQLPRVATVQQAEALQGLLRDFERAKRYNAWLWYQPVPKQLEFLSCQRREKMFSAGNRQGKTESAAFEIACHATGQYPDWWRGRRYDRPVTIWVVGITAKQLVEPGAPQQKLLGVTDINQTDDLGTGLVPQSALDGKPSASRAVTGGADTVQVKHVSGKNSIITFKASEQGRQAMQGAAVDIVWFDEEPPMDIYMECITRTMSAEDGCIFVTFTPLLGETELFLRFTQPPDDLKDLVAFFNMTIDDCTWYSPEHRATMMAQFPVRERRARALGLPFQGSGMVFRTDEANIRTPAVPLRQLQDRGLRFIWGMDWGWKHPFAASLCAYDPELEWFCVIHTIKLEGEAIAVHAAALRRVAGEVPVAWPHDIAKHDPAIGEPLKALYRQQGLRMLPIHAQDKLGHNSLYASLDEMDEWMRESRFQVFDTCMPWFAENRGYHYDKDGKVVPIRDDVISSSRYGFMMRRFARAVPLGPVGAPKPRKPGARLPPLSIGADSHEDYGY